MKRILLTIFLLLLAGLGVIAIVKHELFPDPSHFKAKNDEAVNNRVIIRSVLAQSDEGAGEGTIHNLGFGPSNAQRIDDMIKKLRPESPLIGHGGEIVSLAREFNVDPLMIILTVKESQLCSDNGANVPGGSDPDNFNCGNITWQAAQEGAEVSRWNAKEGPHLTYDGFTYVFTFVPTMPDGIGLFFDYIDNPLYTGKTLIQFYETYNSCTNPGNQSNNFACGAKSAQEMLQLLEEYAGAPCTGSDCSIGSVPSGSSFGSIPGLTLVVRPKIADSWVINQAYAEVIGGRSPDQSSGGSPSTNAVALVRAAEDIKTAFDVCADKDGLQPGDTHATGRPELTDCLREQLLALKYSAEDTDIFEIKRQNALVGSPVGRGECNQCLGFVGTVVALATKTTDGAKTLAADGMGTAANLNDDSKWGKNGFAVGNDLYKPIGSGNAADIQVGDIAVSSNGDGGHIGIVRELIAGTDTHFEIIESNGYVDCRVTTDRGPIPKEGYTFYRKA